MARDGPMDSDGLLEVETVDLDAYMSGMPEQRRTQCRKAADSLHRTGCLFVRDPRVREEDNDRFLDMMERYYEGSDGKRDVRPDVHYQVGVLPAFMEQPRDHCAAAMSMPAEDRPSTICPPGADPKWRFFWRVGSRPASSRFPELNMEPVQPPEFPEWAQVMDSWGRHMLEAAKGVGEMAAEGFGLPKDAFTRKMQDGPHLLAPTGSDFSRFGALGTVLAGLHTDLNFLTVHGRSRFPGLYIWLRSGRKVAVRVPADCLLVQAGKQMEHLTAGHVLAGFHEVVVTEATADVISRRKKEGKGLWRVSSTLFSHIASDQILEPAGHFATDAARAKFPPVLAGDQVNEELRAIKLSRSRADAPPPMGTQ